MGGVPESDPDAVSAVPDPQRRFFDAAFDILATEGYGGLKLAPLCRRLGLTTGAFYHSFESWQQFTDALLDHWLQDRTLRLADLARAEPDPAQRVEMLLQVGVGLPHRAEAAIRVWAGIDPTVRALQSAVDSERLAAVTEAFEGVVKDKREAARLGHAALYLVIGYEQAAAQEPDALEWGLRLLQRRAMAPREE